MWPNKRVKRGTKQAYIPIDDITQPELSLGFVRIISDRVTREAERGDSATVSTAMLAFMEQWSDDVLDFPFPTILGYVKAVFFALEQGRIRWTDADQLRALRTRAVEKSARLQTDEAPSQPAVASRAKATTKSKQTRWCADFNNGECTSSQCRDSHICRFCFQHGGNKYTHKGSQCNTHKVNPTKN
jgi:hypothetical protein